MKQNYEHTYDNDYHRYVYTVTNEHDKALVFEYTTWGVEFTERYKDSADLFYCIDGTFISCRLTEHHHDPDGQPCNLLSHYKSSRDGLQFVEGKCSTTTIEVMDIYPLGTLVFIHNREGVEAVLNRMEKLL